MKKLLFLGGTAMILVANLSSCKKGENDPTLSLKSRKARLTGEWTVTNIVKANSEVNSSNPFFNTTTSGSYANGILTEVTTNTSSGIVTQTSTEEITTTYEFLKDGTYVQTNVHSNFTDVITGNWIFMGKNKAQDLKKKESIMLYITKWVQTDNDGVSQTITGSGISLVADVFTIDQLKSKEIILIDENSTVQGSTTSTNKTTYTLTAK